MSTTTAATSEKNAISRIVEDYVTGFKSLFTCPREIWITYLIKISESLCYFSSVLVLMLFLTRDMGLSDTAAGTIFGIFSASMSFFMLFVGFIADSLGIKKALLVGLIIALVGRLAITFTLNPWIVYPGLFALSVGFAYMIPLIAAAVKIFSNKKAQKYAFSWYYVVMNIGSLIAGITLDGLRTKFTSLIEFSFLGMDLVVRPLQMIFFVAVGATIVSIFLVLFFIRSHIPKSAYNEPEDEVEDGKPQKGEAKDDSAFKIFLDVIIESRFLIFLTFIFLLVLVKMIFQYNHSLYPVYMERIGLMEWTGKLYSINPFIIIFLVPVMTSMTSKLNSYKVIMIGSFVSAVSVLFMGINESILMIVLFQVVLSFGEALYSPRIYDYTATIAPPGKEASYMAYSKAPMFFAKVAAGPITGILLHYLCPIPHPKNILSEVVAGNTNTLASMNNTITIVKDNIVNQASLVINQAQASVPAEVQSNLLSLVTPERNTELMWIIVAVSTLVSPVLLLLGMKWLDVESNPDLGTGNLRWLEKVLLSQGWYRRMHGIQS